jgi:hypothetical protein
MDPPFCPGHTPAVLYHIRPAGVDDMIYKAFSLLTRLFKIFPNIYLYSSYPLMELLRHLWEAQRIKVNEKKPISPYVIEVVAMLDEHWLSLTLAMRG